MAEIINDVKGKLLIVKRNYPDMSQNILDLIDVMAKNIGETCNMNAAELLIYIVSLETVLKHEYYIINKEISDIKIDMDIFLKIIKSISSEKFFYEFNREFEKLKSIKN